MERTRRNRRRLLTGIALVGFCLLGSPALQSARAATENLHTVDTGGLDDFASLSAWEAHIDDAPDLVTADIYVKVNCRSSDGSDDTTPVVFGGMTTSAACCIWVHGADFPATGAYDATKYLLNTGADTVAVTMNEEYVKFTHIQFLVSTSTGTGRGVYINSVATSVIIIDSCIFYGSCAGSGGAQGIYLSDSSSTANITNTVVCNIVSGTDADFSGYLITAGAMNMWNCVAYGNRYGIRQASGGTGVATNCAVGNNSLDDFAGSITVDYCCSDDGDETTEGSHTHPAGGDWTTEFTNAGVGDFSLKNPASSGLVGTGTADPGAGDQPDLDIIGTARPQGAAWDIGAFELIVAAPGTAGQVIFVTEDET